MNDNTNEHRSAVARGRAQYLASHPRRAAQLEQDRGVDVEFDPVEERARVKAAEYRRTITRPEHR
ncbi:MAG: hypothetical protein ACTMIR_15900 [Cellulomonadaceae bacterium]